MEFHKAKKVVIVTEAALLKKIIALITGMGVGGYTVQAATGSGERGIRADDDVSGMFKNVRIDAITSEENATKIAAQVVEKFFDHYAGIVYMQDVEIIRAGKFRLPD